MNEKRYKSEEVGLWYFNGKYSVAHGPKYKYNLREKEYSDKAEQFICISSWTIKIECRPYSLLPRHKI